MKKLISLLIVFIAVISFSVTTASADTVGYNINDGSIVIGEADDEINIYVEQKGVKKVISPATVITVSGTAQTSNTITVKNNVTCNMILHNVNILSNEFLKAAFCIDNGEKVNLTLVGNNSLISGDFMAGLQTSKRSTLNIDGAGTLTATGGCDAAGIGGGWRRATAGSDAGIITVGGSVAITATGGENGAGIGGGSQGSMVSLTLKGSARINALGGKGAAGIGAGNGGSLGTVSILNSVTVNAKGGENGAGIGGGELSEIDTITVSTSGKIRAYGGNNAAAIGTGSGGKLNVLTFGSSGSARLLGGNNAAALGLGNASTGSLIKITDKATVFCVGGTNAAGVGTGKKSNLEKLTVDSGASVTAFGGALGAGVGTGANSNLLHLEILGNSKVTAFGGIDGAGVGGGSSSTPSTLTISGYSGVNAVGGLGAAGIGSGFGASYSNITISGSANVNAQGGNYGAGIGSGGRSAEDKATPNSKIIITDQAKVNAYGGKYSAGIGGGVFASGSILEVSQNAKVYATNENTIKLVNSAPDQYSLVSENTAIGTSYVLNSYIKDPDVDPLTQDTPICMPTPVAATYSAASRSYKVGTKLSMPAGNGAGCSVMGSYHISGGATLNGMYGDVTLTLKMGTGGTDIVVSLTKNASYTLPETVTKNGYKFKGWYRDEELKKPVNGSIKVSQDTVIYSAWDAVQVELTEDQIPYAFINKSYAYKFQTAAGSSGTEFSLASGTLPNGLTLSSDGSLSGTPTAEGSYTFTIKYLNSNGTSGTKEVILNIYGNNSYVFEISTGESNGAGTKAQVMMSFEFTDRFTGEKVTTETVNLTSLLLNYYDDPLQPGAIVELPLVFEPNVGEPENIILSCNSEDGWHCRSISVKFAGNSMYPAFQKDFNLDSWYGTNDDSSFWTIVLTVVIIIASVAILAGVAFIILVRNPKTRAFLKRKGLLKNKKA